MTESNNKEWSIVSLVPDFSSKAVCNHFSKKLKDVKEAQIWLPYNAKKMDISNEVAAKVGNFEKRTLSVYGSGSYHHLTYGLCRLASDLSHNLTYIHIDHHSDAYKNTSGKISCGSFVQDIVDDGFAKEFLLIGSVHRSAAGFTDEHSLRKTGMATLDEILGNSRCNDVYLSIDLDVMKKDELSSTISRGTMERGMLLEAISHIKSRKNIVSADILGYAISLFPSKKKKSMQLYESIAKAILGEDEWELHVRK